MTKDEIIDMALEEWRSGDQVKQAGLDRNYTNLFKAFAKLVAAKAIAELESQEPVAWLLTDKNINSLQVDSIQRLIDRLKHAHHTDLCVRINGQDEWFQADWLKHMVRVTPPQRTEPPAWFPAVENILNEYGLQAIDFVADFKAAMKDAEQSQRTEEKNT